MITKLDVSDKKRIEELSQTFDYVLGDVLADLLNNSFSQYLLFIDNNRIVGFLNYYLIYDRIEIANFNVLDIYQNKKIGSRLLKRLISDYLNKVKNITLEVRENNKKAIYLYKKYEFREVAVRKGYYDDCDAILMERSMML